MTHLNSVMNVSCPQMYVCVYVTHMNASHHTYTCVHAIRTMDELCTHTHTHTHMHTYVCTGIYMFVYKYVYTQTYMHIHIYIYAYIYIHTLTHIYLRAPLNEGRSCFKMILLVDIENTTPFPGNYQYNNRTTRMHEWRNGAF